MKPIIGIPAKFSMTEGLRDALFVRAELKDAINFNGGIAIGILPTHDYDIKPFDQPLKLSRNEIESLKSQLNLCDGVVLQGGSVCDKYEEFVSKFCYENDIPILGICAGQNHMAKSLGGETTFLSNPEKHHQAWVDNVHKITIKKGTLLHKILKVDELMVNSRHKTIVSNPSESYIVSALDDDGNIEAIEAPNKRFNLAVRFHPESLYKKYASHNKIFKEFIAACKKSQKIDN